MMSAHQEKKKTSDGSITYAFLYYDRSDLLDYELTQYAAEGTSPAHHFDEDVTISFGIDGSVLSEAFPKTGLKSTSMINLFSKSGSKNLFYSKDKGEAVFTLKTLVGFNVDHSATTPAIIMGERSYPFLLEGGKKAAIAPVPNASLTIEGFTKNV